MGKKSRRNRPSRSWTGPSTPDAREVALYENLRLTAQEEEDLPKLLQDAPSYYPSDRYCLQKLTDKINQQPGHTGSVTIFQVADCVACLEKLEKSAFTINQWVKRDEYSPRCRVCVKEGRFNYENTWPGTPKGPFQILWELGWIDPEVPTKALKDVYPSERLGKMVTAMPNRDFLLQVFETEGHHGYGGLEEGLCCMPGCLVDADEKLKVCSRCKVARYCCVEHQRDHYHVHKEQCQALAAGQKKGSLSGVCEEVAATST